MTQALWNGKVIAESDVTVDVEGNAYFPPDSLVKEHFETSPTTSVCGWKGTASYYHLVVDGQRNTDAAWYYPTPLEAAENIRDHVAFWKGVEVRD